MSTSEESPAKVYLLTLGCPKNDADSRSIGRDLRAAGVDVVDEPSCATHIVVNTCGFIQSAKEESIETILDVCREYPDKHVLAMGCLVQRYRDELTQGIPEVSDWLGIAGGDTSQRLLDAVSEGDGYVLRTGIGRRREAESYAYVKISDGCDEGCTFCAIPGIKGPYVALRVDDILREVDSCLAEGAKEIVLVGQDTTRWRSDGLGLHGLIETLASDQRVRRIRVMYLQPTMVDDALLEFMSGHEKLCQYLDVPFQHSHPTVLHRMGRRGDGESYSDLLRRARDLMPRVATRSTFIVGFPGETERHFAHLLDFVESAGFDYGGAFVYSPEEGTTAERMRPRVGHAVAKKRLERLSDALLQSGVSRRESLLGEELEVLVDSVDLEETVEGGKAVGRTEGQAPEVDGVTHVVGPRCGELLPGDMVRVKITDVLGCDLIGEISAS